MLLAQTATVVVKTKPFDGVLVNPGIRSLFSK